MKKILVATYPFGLCGEKPVNILRDSGCEIIYNSLGRRLKGNEVIDMIEDIDGVIAGTEPYSKEIIEKAKKLKVISRVGVGLDSVDFDVCKNNGVILTYTPEAPAEGVADLAVAQIVNLLRGIISSDKSIRNGIWERYMGSLVSEKKIGILGVGRIGSRVIKRLKSFGAKVIFACDLFPKVEMDDIIWMSKEELFKNCDIVSIHIPMSKNNFHCVSMKEMSIMREGSFIINTSRGSIINEKDLISLLYNKHLGGAALDVFENEPDVGSLKEFDNVILTAHIGASARQSRYLMELGAAEDCVRILNGEKPVNQVTEHSFYE